MERIYWYFAAAVVLFVLSLSSCNSSEDIIETDDFVSSYQGKYKSLNQQTSDELKEFAHYAFFGGIEKAYDAQMDFFDLDVYENYLLDYPKLVATRGSIELDIPLMSDLLAEAKSELSAEAFIIYEQLVTADKLSENDLAGFQEQINSLNDDDRYFLTYIIDNVLILSEEYNSYIASLATTRSIGCGIAAGCCAEALGWVASLVIGGPWAGVAHLAITIVSGAVMAEARC